MPRWSCSAAPVKAFAYLLTQPVAKREICPASLCKQSQNPRFQISKESAKYFLRRVQKSFKIEWPPQQLIVEFMSAQTFETLPKPHEVARMMNENGVWVHALNPEPPAAIDEEDIYVE